MTEHVAVLMGGWSAEREVSLVSGEACAAALEQSGYRVTRIDPSPDIGKLHGALTPKPDFVFNALHGRFGEDGPIQGILDILEIPYTHSGLAASAMAMNKALALRLFKMVGIPTAKNTVLSPKELCERSAPLSYPYVVKPVQEGSSIGIHIIQSERDIPDYNEWPHGDVLLEEYIPGRELTVAVMEKRALGVTELRPHEGFYDYKAKYADERTIHLCPAPISKKLTQLCTEYALRAHEVLGCRGVTRADFRYDDKTDRLVILELNTQPGMTPTSLVPEQAKNVGIGFRNLVVWMVEHAQCG